MKNGIFAATASVLAMAFAGVAQADDKFILDEQQLDQVVAGSYFNVGNGQCETCNVLDVVIIGDVYGDINIYIKNHQQIQIKEKKEKTKNM